MSYQQAMKWGRKHIKGTKQPVIMSTSSGFWPSHHWVVEDWEPYIAECKAKGIEPMGCKEYYDYGVTNKQFRQETPARPITGKE
jgi:hypothetical protein